MKAPHKEYVLVTEYFHPDTASTGQLMTDLAVELQKRGLDMTVCTGQPNYHSGENHKQPPTDTHEDVLVKRVRAPQVRQSSFLRRGFNWIVFTVGIFVALLTDRPEREREVIFVTNPPSLPVAMWLVCLIRGWEYTHIVYDLYPDFLVEKGYLDQDGVVATVWTELNRRVFGDAQNIVALGPVMRDRIARNAGDGFDESKITIIHNWEDEDFIEPIHKEDNWFSEAHELVEPFTLLYSGNIGENHDLETFIQALAEFNQEDVKVMVIGEGDKKRRIRELAHELGLVPDTIEFLPYQPIDTLPYSLTSGNVSIVTTEKGMEGVCVSSKLYSALAAGQPVFVIAQPNDDEARIIEDCGAGIQVSQGDIEGVVEAVNRWRSNPALVHEQGRNARAAFEQRFTKETSIEQYYRLLSNNCTEENGRSVSDGKEAYLPD